MTMSYVWTAMLLTSVLYALTNGTTSQLAEASLEGASTAVTLALSMTGTICLWSGIMEVLRQCGLSNLLAKLMTPLLKKLFPDAANDTKTLADISANFSANFLGLGNAATPLGLQAVKGLSAYAPDKSTATPSLCLFIVCNTASIQLLPTTVASLRSATGSQDALQILPAVWLSSTLSVTTGILICKFFEKHWDNITRKSEKPKSRK